MGRGTAKAWPTILKKILGSRAYLQAVEEGIKFLPPPEVDEDDPTCIVDINSWIHYTLFKLGDVRLAVECSVEIIRATATWTCAFPIKDGTFATRPRLRVDDDIS